MEGRGRGISYRKLDHLRICVDSPVETGDTLLGDVELPYSPGDAIPPGRVDVSTWLGGRRLRAPIMITGITGGHEVAEELNCALGVLSAEYGVAVGVGSQRAGIEHPALASTFRAVRRCGGSDAVVVANIGVAQLLQHGAAYAEKAVEMIEADAIAVHMNPAQEAFQPEGDVVERAAETVARLVEKLSVPLIVKETGHGLDSATIKALRSAGVRFFDVSGAGGTSWVLVESLRARGGMRLCGSWMSGLGTPTALALAEARWWAPDSCIVASGGVRSGRDAAAALLLGADMVGFALPVLRLYVAGGLKAVRSYLEALIYSIRAAIGLSGARSLEEYWGRRLIVAPRLLMLLGERGIDFNLYRAVRGWGGRGRCRA